MNSHWHIAVEVSSKNILRAKELYLVDNATGLILGSVLLTGGIVDYSVDADHEPDQVYWAVTDWRRSENGPAYVGRYRTELQAKSALEVLCRC
jgi:hypothetical protein